MQQHAVTARLATVIDSEIKTTRPLEASSVMAPKGARHVFHEFLRSPRRPYCHRGYLWSNPSNDTASFFLFYLLDAAANQGSSRLPNATVASNLGRFSFSS